MANVLVLASQLIPKCKFYLLAYPARHPARSQHSLAIFINACVIHRACLRQGTVKSYVESMDLIDLDRIKGCGLTASLDDSGMESYQQLWYPR